MLTLILRHLLKTYTKVVYMVTQKLIKYLYASNIGGISLLRGMCKERLCLLGNVKTMVQ